MRQTGVENILSPPCMEIVALTCITIVLSVPDMRLVLWSSMTLSYKDTHSFAFLCFGLSSSQTLIANCTG